MGGEECLKGNCSKEQGLDCTGGLSRSKESSRAGWAARNEEVKEGVGEEGEKALQG